MSKRIDYESTLKENEILIEHNHKCAEIGGEYVVMKYCPSCRQWHPLGDYNKCSNTEDGLQSWCKECQSEYHKLRNAMKATSTQAVTEISTPTEESVEESNCFETALELLATMQQRDEEQKYEIEKLKTENKTLRNNSIDLSSLCERDIEKVLMNNKIAPRLLFNAIARQDDRYTFIVKDRVSGQTYPIKIEQNVA